MWPRLRGRVLAALPLLALTVSCRGCSKTSEQPAASQESRVPTKRELESRLSATVLKGLGFATLDDAFRDAEIEMDEQPPPFPVPGFISRELAAGEVLAEWLRVRTALDGSRVAVLVSSAEALELDFEWPRVVREVEILHQAFSHSAFPGDAGAERALRDSEWNGAIAAEVERRFSEPRVLAVLDRFGVRVPGPITAGADDLEDDEALADLWDAADPAPPPSKSLVRGAPYRLVKRVVPFRGEAPGVIDWRFPLQTDEGPMRIVVLALDRPALAPLYLRWLFDMETALKVAPLFASWEAAHGFDVVFLGRDTLEALVPHRPRSLEALQRLVVEHAAFCPDLAQDELVPAALFNLLGHQWSFWWD